MSARELDKHMPTPPTRKQVLIVDDHPVVRQGLRALIDQTQDMQVCGEAQTIHDALRCVDHLKPDVVAVDISLGGDNGLDLIKDIRIRYPKMPVLTLSVHEVLPKNWTSG